MEDHRLPEPVERYLRTYADKTTSLVIKACAGRLLDAPCSRQAFANIAARLEEEHVERANDLIVLIADSALMAGCAPHSKIRQAAQEHHDLIQAAIDAAEAAVFAFESAENQVNGLGLDTGGLLDLFDDEHLEMVSALTAWTRQAQSVLDQAEPVGTLMQASSRAIAGRKFNPWAAFHHDFGTRLDQAAKGHQITEGYQLRDSEVAGLTAAAIAWKDDSPISRTSEKNDYRTEKTRTARTSEIGK